MKKIFILLSIFSVSLAAYAQLDVVVTADGASGGKVQIKNDENNSNAFTGITNGSGAGLHGWNTSTAGVVVGVRGTSASSSGGTIISGVTGVYGHINTTTPGSFSAGVRGVNNGTGFIGAGVIGYHAGAGWGVFGQSPNGFGVYGFASHPTNVGVGVRGETIGKYGAGVEAKYSGTGVGIALKIDNGAIKVAGTNKAAFVHTSTVANKKNNSTTIDNPMCNEDPSCLLFVTQLISSETVVYNNSPVGVSYDYTANKWIIFNENGATMPTNALFNVLVIKQ
jgi:hypothetical protein